MLQVDEPVLVSRLHYYHAESVCITLCRLYRRSDLSIEKFGLEKTVRQPFSGNRLATGGRRVRRVRKEIRTVPSGFGGASRAGTKRDPGRALQSGLRPR